MKSLLGSLGIVMALCSPVAAHAGAYTVTTFIEAGAEATSFFDINNGGTIVGYSAFGSGATASSHGIVLSGGALTTLTGPAGAAFTHALGISDTGVVVGSYAGASTIDPGSGELIGAASRGFIYSAGTYTNFEVAGATHTFLRAVSPNGRYMSGYFQSSADLGRGFVYDSVAATLAYVGAGGNDFTIAQGVNDAGLLVGSDILRDDVTGAVLGRVGFIYDIFTATRTDFDTPGYLRTAFRAITSDAEVSGWLTQFGGDAVGFTGGPAGRELLSVDVQTFVEGNNDARSLVGTAYRADGSVVAFVAHRVPEPGSLALSALALAALMRLRRRR